MNAPLRTSDSRFILESRTHAGLFVCELPYRNIQTESMLGSSGHSLRCEIPYRNYRQVTQQNLYPGKHEVWLWDQEQAVTTGPIFAGPIWDGTISSSTGVISISAQDPLSFLAKRLLKVSKVYSAQLPVDMINDLITYVNSVRATNITVNGRANGTQTVSATYKPTDNNVISDLIASIATMGEGVDYFFRYDISTDSHSLILYGGLIKPTALALALEYGGNLDGYSLQLQAQPIANEFNLMASNGLRGVATDATSIATNDALYQTVDSSDLQSSTLLNNAAAIRLKDTASPKQIPSLVTRKYTPIKDFDFGDQFTVSINDEYAQYNGLIRVEGWQLTIGQGDSITTVIYTKDTSAVT